MQSALYLLLALRSLKKNYRIALPLFGGSAILVALFYSILALPYSLSHHFVVDQLLAYAYFSVIGMICQILIVIFFIYLNTIWNNTRAKENAIFTSLGMEKGQLIRILFYQLVVFFLFSFVVGFILGICLEKVLLLFLLKLLGLPPLFGFYLSWDAISATAHFIFLCYGMWFVLSTISILRSKPLEHLHQTQDIEKPLKAPIFFSLLGLVCLLSGYAIATTAHDQLYLMVNFFNAVLLVIIGTYLLFLYGSSILLELLCKNKKAYYQTRHFIFWSTMKTQLRKNALALANMSILSTMLLITCATTISLQLSTKDTIEIRYPDAFQLTIDPYSEDVDSSVPTTQITTQSIRQDLDRLAKERQVEFQNLSILPFTTVPLQYEHYQSACVVPLEAFNETLHTHYQLGEDEIFVLDAQYYPDSLEILNQYDVDILPLEINKRISWIGESTPYLTIIANSDSIASGYQEQLFFSFDLVNAKTKEKLAQNDETCNLILEIFLPFLGDQYSYVYTQADFVKSIQYTYSMILITGLYTATIFLLAVILILYFKQITQGQEDRKRFKIMKQVGLDPDGLRKIINSQVRIMFFSPLITALAHILFAYPLIQKLLNSISYSSIDYFIVVLIGCFMIFALIYWIIFKLTARTYYKLALLNDQSDQRVL